MLLFYLITLDVGGWLGTILGSGVGVVVAGYLAKTLWNAFISPLMGQVIAKPLISIHLCQGSLLDWANLFGLIPLSIAASVGISLIIYLVGKILQHDQMVLEIKAQIFDLFLTLAVISVVIALLKLPCHIYVIQHNGVRLNLYESAFFYLQVAEYLNAALLGLSIDYYVITMFILRFTISNAVFGGLSLQAYSGAALTIKPFLSKLMVGITTAYTSAVVQVFLYEFLTFGAVKYVLPLGIFLRTFSPFKRIGGALIGFSLASPIFYSVVAAYSFPILDSYSIIRITSLTEHPRYYTARIMVLPLGTDIKKKVQPLTGEMEYNGKTVDIVHEMITTTQEEMNKNSVKVSHRISIRGVINTIKKIVYYLHPVHAIKGIFKLAFHFLRGIYEGMVNWSSVVCSTGAIIGCLLPLIHFLVLTAGTRFMARFFGEDIDISNLTKVV